MNRSDYESLKSELAAAGWQSRMTDADFGAACDWEYNCPECGSGDRYGEGFSDRNTRRRFSVCYACGHADEF